MFSPYYALRRRSGDVPAEQHCAFNVALYGNKVKRWAMTERGCNRVERDASQLRIGPSSMSWRDGTLEIDIEEWSAPVPHPIRGKIRLTPAIANDTVYQLGRDGQHSWRPIAPSARVEVSMTEPGMRWTGSGYFDCNFGAAPLEQEFSRWDWSRSELDDGSAVVFYDATRRDRSSAALALRFMPDGQVRSMHSPLREALPVTGWKLDRLVRTEAKTTKILRGFEDGPFYSRSLISTELFGMPARTLHETLSLDRFAKPWVQAMLPFRMPRAIG